MFDRESPVRQDQLKVKDANLPNTESPREEVFTFANEEFTAQECPCNMSVYENTPTHISQWIDYMKSIQKSVTMNTDPCEIKHIKRLFIIHKKQWRNTYEIYKEQLLWDWIHMMAIQGENCKKSYSELLQHTSPKSQVK